MKISATATFSILLGGLAFLGGTLSAQAPSVHTFADSAACASRGFSSPVQWNRHFSASSSCGTIQTAKRRGRGVCRPTIILSRVVDPHTFPRLGYQIRNVAATVRLERQVSGGWKRRLERRHSVWCAGGRVAPRIRRRIHRYGTRGRQCEFCSGPPGKGDRFRLSRHSRNGLAGQGRHCRAVRQRAAFVVLHRLLGRRQAGVRGSATFP